MEAVGDGVGDGVECIYAVIGWRSESDSPDWQGSHVDGAHRKHVGSEHMAG